MFKSNQCIYFCIYYHSAQNFNIYSEIEKSRDSRRTEGSINIDMNKYVLKKKKKTKTTCLSLTL